MVTAGMRDSVTLTALNSGVAGIIFKHSGPGQLIEAIHRVAKGEMWLDTGVVRSLISSSGEKPESAQGVRSLSDRQRMVLRSILDGLTNKEIASQLQVSETSIKASIQELFDKAGVRTRSQLVRIAIEKYSADWLRNEEC
jgi:DNA-binding NarL/FixJ family response regulator